MFEFIVLLVILFNTAMLMLDDPTSEETDPIKLKIEEFFLIAYTTEMALKIVAQGFVLNKNCSFVYFYHWGSVPEGRLEHP